jgi:hypothetical protein
MTRQEQIIRNTIFDLAWELVHASDDVAIDAASLLEEAGVEPNEEALALLSEFMLGEIYKLRDVVAQASLGKGLEVFA